MYRHIAAGPDGRKVFLTVFCGILLLAVSLAYAQGDGQAPAINWQSGPSTADLGTNAQIEVPAGFIFAGPEDTRRIMEMSQNPPSGKELGFISPETSEWFVLFAFDDVGYVNDKEKGELDADALLRSIRKGNDAGNAERKRRGWATMNIVGWEQPPQYNPTTNNLEWAVRAESEGHADVNYHTRLLGRGGVMRVTLVSTPENLWAIMPQFKSVIAGFTFKPGSRYAEFRAGDKIAEYGLSALVVGGATAVAAKTGILKAFGKGIYALAVAGFGAIASLFRAISFRVKRFFGIYDRSRGR